MLKHCSKRLARIDALHKTLPCVHASVALQTIATQIGHDPDPEGGLVDCTQFFAQFCNYGYVVNDIFLRWILHNAMLCTLLQKTACQWWSRAGLLWDHPVGWLGVPHHAESGQIHRNTYIGKWLLTAPSHHFHWRNSRPEQTRPERGIIDPVSLLHSWYWSCYNHIFVLTYKN